MLWITLLILMLVVAAAPGISLVVEEQGRLRSERLQTSDVPHEVS